MGGEQVSIDACGKHWSPNRRLDTRKASMAKLYCSEAFFCIVAETIQLHGGICFTWEHRAHLYFRRARSSEYLLGSLVKDREVLLQKLGV